MIESNDEAEKYVRDNYGLDLTFFSSESFYISDSKHEPYDLSPVEGGSCKLWDLKDAEGIIYRLIVLPEAPPITEEELIKRLENESFALTIKEWKKLTPILKDTEYILYKLVPHTVQGEPHY